MKKLSKRLLAVVLCVVMLLGVAVYTVAAQGREVTIVFDAATGTFTIYNADFTYGEDGKQTYPDLFPEMKGLMPGDSVQQTIKVKVKNAGADTVKLMLKAEDVTAEPDRNPTNDDYDKLVSYKTESDEGVELTVKFEDQRYNGELKRLGADATEDKTQGVYLGAYTGNDSEKELTVDLSIPLEAGNELQGLTAQLGWVITAEVIPHKGGGGDSDGGSDEPYPDVDLDVTNHYAYIIGRKDGNIHPWAQITRGEVATIYFRMLTDDSRNAYWSTSNPYPDVAPNTWCNNAISTMTKAGVVKGYTDGLFRQNAPITRAEFATMAARFFNVTYDGPDKFSDIGGHWAKDYINQAAEAGIILGYQDGTFQPDRYISRAEAITIFNRVLERHPEKDHLLDDMITWPDNMDENEWFYANVQEATNSHDYEMMTGPDGEKYEVWTKLQPVRDWAAFENEWATANAAPNPGNVYSSSKSSVK